MASTPAPSTPPPITPDPVTPPPYTPGPVTPSSTAPRAARRLNRSLPADGRTTADTATADSTVTTTLDWRSYPYIFERIVFYSNLSTLLAISRTSKGAHTEARKAFLRHIVLRCNGEIDSLVPGFPQLGPSFADCTIGSRKAFRLPLGLPRGLDLYRDPTLAGYVRTIDFYHHFSVTRPHFCVLNYDVLASLLVNIRIVRHRLIAGGSLTAPVRPHISRSMDTRRSTIEIWFGHLDSTSREDDREVLYLPGPSGTCTTAILNFDLSPCWPRGIKWDNTQLRWDPGSSLSHVILLCAPPAHTFDSIAEDCPFNNSPICQSVVQLVKSAMVQCAVRVTVVNLHSCWYRTVIPKVVEELSVRKQKEPVNDIRRNFLDRFDTAQPEWPSTTVRQQLLGNVRFLSLDQWRGEVGEALYDLATVEESGRKVEYSNYDPVE